MRSRANLGSFKKAGDSANSVQLGDQRYDDEKKRKELELKTLGDEPASSGVCALGAGGQGEYGEGEGEGEQDELEQGPRGDHHSDQHD